MFFDINEITAKKILITPRVCIGGELVALWIEAYGKANATHIWDIAVSRAFSNKAEIDIAIASEMKRTGKDYEACGREMILKSGVYELKQKGESKQTIELDSEFAASLLAAADRDGVSVEEYLQKLITQKSQITYKTGTEK
jgi:hypothetical protein